MWSYSRENEPAVMLRTSRSFIRFVTEYTQVMFYIKQVSVWERLILLLSPHVTIQQVGMLDLRTAMDAATSLRARKSINYRHLMDVSQVSFPLHDCLARSALGRGQGRAYPPRLFKLLCSHRWSLAPVARRTWMTTCASPHATCKSCCPQR